jgi:hypothetical protein
MWMGQSMAESQPGQRRLGDERFDSGDDDLSLDDWMARRNAQVAQRHEADLAGRQAWADAIRTGHDVNAARPGDVRATGMRALSRQPVRGNPSHGYNPDEPRDWHGRWTTGAAGAATTHPAAQNKQAISYGLLTTPAPSNQELAELRRQQAAFANITRKLDLQNSWLAIPALAPPLIIGGLEGAAAWAARAALPEAEQAPLNLVRRDPHLRVGDNWATRAGRRAHAALEERLDGKPGWKYEPDLQRPGQRPLKPDVGTPPRNSAKPESRKYLELKPNTPSGRAAAARAVKRYKGVTRDKVRPIYYNPKDFM